MATTEFPEARVLVIMTGGTICMKQSPDGMVPARGFLEQGMAPRPSFNDGSNPGERLSSFVVINFKSGAVREILRRVLWNSS